MDDLNPKDALEVLYELFNQALEENNIDEAEKIQKTLAKHGFAHEASIIATEIKAHQELIKSEQAE